MPDQNLTKFTAIVEPVTTVITKGGIDAHLEARLNEVFPPSGEIFRNIETECRQAISDGWMCSQGSKGRRFGRVLEPSPETSNLSVDVVDLTNIVGPHHRHPTGEVCMIMPVTETARFDGHDAGWCVNLPGSAHRPTVTDGRALVLYLLPEGKIEFTE